MASSSATGGADSGRTADGRLSSSQSTLSPEQVRAIVHRELRLMDAHPPKCMPTGSIGTHGEAIRALGQAAVSQLIDEIADTTPTRWEYGNHTFVVGDFALDLLGDICKCPNDVLPALDGGTWKDFIERPGSRARVQQAWRAFATRDGGGC